MTHKKAVWISHKFVCTLANEKYLIIFIFWQGEPKYLNSYCPTYSIVFQFTFIFIHLRDTISASFPNCRTNKCIFCFGFDIYISKSFLKWCLFIKEENIPWYTAYCPQTEKNIYVYINAKGLFKNALDKYVLPSTFHILTMLLIILRFSFLANNE